MAKRNHQTPATGIGAVVGPPIHDDTEPVSLTGSPVELPGAVAVEMDSVAVDVEADLPEVLVVDDEPANLQAVEAALDGLRTRIVCVSSGQEALRELLCRNVALILLDVQLPTLDGFETARFIRSRSRNRHVPIIFLTAYNQNEEDIRRGYKLGAVDYLFKPFAPEVLRAKVQAFIDLRNRTAEVRAQAHQLRELERQASERRLREARREWEADALRRQMEEQRKINQQLADADRRKDEFLAVLAHELRNPLAPLVAGLELIRLEEARSQTIERARQAMTRQVGHLVRLVDDLLDVSRISRGKVELHRQHVDLRSCIEQAVETCMPIAERSGQTLHVNVPDDPLMCDADPVRVTQVLNNLLGNAVRYTEPGGEIHLDATAKDEEAVLCVRDNGKGISAEMLGRVFDMFVQEQSGGGGLGLGLTLVDQVVKMHGGSVEARSDGPGLGSEFEVRLPRLVTQAKAPKACAPTDEKDDEEGQLRILLVDDQEDIASTTRELLEAWGHQVHVAYSGREGIAMASEIRPDVALLDIGLPDLDGYRVASCIREELGDQRPRLVAITGFGQDRDRVRAREAGFDGHLVKPARPDQLRRMLRRSPATAVSVSS